LAGAGRFEPPYVGCYDQDSSFEFRGLVGHSLCDDHRFSKVLRCHGYLPPPDQFELGGYTTWRARSSYLEVGAEPQIQKAVGLLLKRVARSKKP